MILSIREFLKTESAGGMVLMVVAVLAMVVANSPLANGYFGLMAPLTLPINDGLMAVFFFLIGLEIRHEIAGGELSTWRKAALPLVGALGGVVVPALIYGWLNWHTPAMRGWAIPCATDIAFSLGVLSLFGRRLPSSLRVFLMALAVIDDLVAVIIIAVFYTAGLSLPALGLALGTVLILFAMARASHSNILSYLLVGVCLWVAMFLSGVHPTIAGVVLGLMMPLKQGSKCIGKLHPWVVFIVMPLFAFANAGVALSGVTQEMFFKPLPLGIILGLFFGKQCGIFALSWLMVRLKLAVLPKDSGWAQFYGVCVVAGIGFTMSLFIGVLAFADPALQAEMRLAVLVGSLLSGLFSCFLLWVICLCKRGPVGSVE